MFLNFLMRFHISYCELILFVNYDGDDFCDGYIGVSAEAVKFNKFDFFLFSDVCSPSSKNTPLSEIENIFESTFIKGIHLERTEKKESVDIRKLAFAIKDKRLRHDFINCIKYYKCRFNIAANWNFFFEMVCYKKEIHILSIGCSESYLFDNDLICDRLSFKEKECFSMNENDYNMTIKGLNSICNTENIQTDLGEYKEEISNQIIANNGSFVDDVIINKTENTNTSLENDIFDIMAKEHVNTRPKNKMIDQCYVKACDKYKKDFIIDDEETKISKFTKSEILNTLEKGLKNTEIINEDEIEDRAQKKDNEINENSDNSTFLSENESSSNSESENNICKQKMNNYFFNIMYNIAILGLGCVLGYYWNNI
ncbi:uncharacterized protein VNE69_08130 [Vairimorpha necatrix]|uniref:Uncharacterized protein n=1 Tax=Vairimorpha necatrix TaxID=6039 RepID=A0AAX4JEG5_9MICR